MTDLISEDLNVLGLKTSKTMTLYGALHPSNADRAHLPRGKGGGGLTCGKRAENVSHIVSECIMIAQKK